MSGKAARAPFPEPKTNVPASIPFLTITKCSFHDRDCVIVTSLVLEGLEGGESLPQRLFVR